MKRTLALLAIFALISTNAFAVTRNNQKVKTDIVLRGGAEVVSGLNVTLTTAGTATRLTTSDIPCNSVTVCGAPNNLNNIYVGGSNTATGNAAVMRNSASVDVGIPLGGGASTDQCTVLAVDNVNKLYAAPRATSDRALVTYTEFV